MTHDRATVVTQVLVDALVDAMTTIIRTEFRRRFTEIPARRVSGGAPASRR